MVREPLRIGEGSWRVGLQRVEGGKIGPEVNGEKEEGE